MADQMKKALMSLMLFFTIFLSYKPFYQELIDINANATLTNNIIGLVVTIFPIFWAMLGIVSLALTVYYVAGEL